MMRRMHFLFSCNPTGIFLIPRTLNTSYAWGILSIVGLHSVTNSTLFFALGSKITFPVDFLPLNPMAPSIFPSKAPFGQKMGLKCPKRAFLALFHPPPPKRGAGGEFFGLSQKLPKHVYFDIGYIEWG